MTALFLPNSIDDLADGFTNVPLAVHTGRISTDALAWADEAVSAKRFRPKNNSYSIVPLVRVNEKGTLDYFHDGAYERRWRHYLVLPDGQREGEVKSESAAMMNPGELGLAILTLGVYALARQAVPSVRQNAKRRNRIKRLYDHSRSQNLREVDAITNAVAVYLEDVQGVANITGKNPEYVKLPWSTQFLEATSERQLQLAAHLAGANAVASYQKGSPARGTPIILK